ncbi:hypothetical protein B0H17DRAFT_1031757 [Mycena rosella]|uniref:Uncharacterized protein n=1 Tax=Mycena rosella TaxID=1033263 RepID=A0AAD7MAR3_MYCRO|nr:hypothetical protein B0H17DRAFT_1031757 [Mycena rosella]
MASPGCFVANPDISGLGVRISFYLQTIALVLLAGRSLEEALSSVWTLLGTSFGLTVSALVTAAQDELPLYQAIIVTDLVWLANYAIFMALATYNRHPRGSHTVQYAALLQTYVSMAVILYLWARAPQLELESPDAGETVFVVLFVSTPATGRGRAVALAITSLLLVGYSAVAYIFLWRRVKYRPERQHTTTQPQPQPHLTPLSLQPAPVSPRGPSAHPNPNRPPPSLALDPHLMTLSVFFGIPYVITLVSTELQIARNRLCDGNSFWGFGQILAMTVTIIPVITTVQAFRKYGWRQRPRVLADPPANTV